MLKMNKYLQKLLKNTSLMIPDCYRYRMISLDKNFSLILSTQLMVFFLLMLSMLFFDVNYVSIIIGGLSISLANSVNIFMEKKLPTLQNFIITVVLKHGLYALILVTATYFIRDLWPHALIGIVLAQIAYLASCFTYARTIWQ